MSRKLLWMLTAATSSLVSLTFLTTAEASTLYQIDDGQSELTIGVAPGPGKYDLLWLNSFTVQPGGEVVRSISLTWGTPSFLSGITAGMPTEVSLYSDPTNDGDPSDAVLLASAQTTVANPNTDVFTSVPVSPTQVSGTFFVAALMRDLELGAMFPASLDTTSPIPNRSWLQFTTPGNTLDASNLAGIRTTESFGLDGNWQLRAEAAAIPTPALLPALIGFGIGVWRKRQSKQSNAQD